MCGILALLAANPDYNVNSDLFDGLTVLQHRGQDAAGMVTVKDGRLHLRKDTGLTRDVFQQHHMEALTGNVGIAHVRYPTAGSYGCAEAQPFYTNFPYGICMAHNGNLTNSEELYAFCRRTLRHVNTDSDSELLMNIFAYHLEEIHKPALSADDIFQAMTQVFDSCRGGYAAVVLINGHGIVAFRDPWGIRPIAYGTKTDQFGVSYVVSSESVAIDGLGYRIERDLAPGEAIYIELNGTFHSKICATQQTFSPCIFEYVYMARPDSVIDGISVNQARQVMGEKLAEKILRTFPGNPREDIDVIMPIPDTSRTAALQTAIALGVPYREGFIKNRYIARTFIMPGQTVRKKSIRQKLNPIRSEFANKRVLLMDDSIVRGNTAKKIVELAYEAGASKVYMASAAPIIRFPNVYGIDMPSMLEFVACNRTEEEVCKEIGADWLIYQDLDDLVDAVFSCSEDRRMQQFDTSCFNGEYITQDITPDYLEKLHTSRNDDTKSNPLVLIRGALGTGGELQNKSPNGRVPDPTKGQSSSPTSYITNGKSQPIEDVLEIHNKS